jgi:hypothetical protein
MNPLRKLFVVASARCSYKAVLSKASNTMIKPLKKSRDNKRCVSVLGREVVMFVRFDEKNKQKFCNNQK